MRSRAIASGLLLSVVFAMLVGCAAAPVVAPTPRAVLLTRARAIPGQFAERVRASAQSIVALVPSTAPGCSAAVAHDGSVIWAGAGGLADLATGSPDTITTRFDIASISKQFTATAILMLQRERRLSLADPIADYVDGLPDWGRVVTLDQLMHHTSRIPDYWVKLDDVGIGFTQAADQQTTLDAIRRETRLEPGEGFLYSNSNYVLLAEVVGRVSGLPLPQFLAANIFTPLGLDMVVAPTLHAPDIALSYDDDLQLQEAGWTSCGHTGVITTPSELARWGDQYRAGTIIGDDFAVGAVAGDDGQRYAAGMDIEPDGRLTHTGRMGGFVSDFAVSADRHTVIAVMCNGHTSDRFGIADALASIWDPPTEFRAVRPRWE